MAVIDFVVTKSGVNAVLDAKERGINLALGYAKIGRGKYTPNFDSNNLRSPLNESRAIISAGSIEHYSKTLNFTLIMSHHAEQQISEIGLYTEDGALFAVAASSTPFFTIYAGIDYTANFGLRLEQSISSNIEIKVDNQVGESTKILNHHLSHEDPHPQYHEYTHKILSEHLAHEDPHPQYALKTVVADHIHQINDKIEQVVNITRVFFPPFLSVTTATNQLLQLQPTEPDNRSKVVQILNPRKPIQVKPEDYVEDGIYRLIKQQGAIYSYLDQGLLYLFCPEGEHEAWVTTRDTDSFSTRVWNRSGFSEIAHLGRGNTLVLDTKRLLEKQGFKPFTDQIPNEIKNGVLVTASSFIIKKEPHETLNYDDRQAVILVCPETLHEGWEIKRQKDQILVDLFKFEYFETTYRARKRWYKRKRTYSELHIKREKNYAGLVNYLMLKAIPLSTPNFGNTYPRILACGISKPTKNILELLAPENLDFNDRKYAIFLTPEGEHEGWEIKRSKEKFAINIWNRPADNTTKIDYTGQVNWAIFQIHE